MQQASTPTTKLSAEGDNAPTTTTRRRSSGKRKAVSKKKSTKERRTVKSHSIESQRSEWGKESTVTVSDLMVLKAQYSIPDSCTLHIQSEGEFYDSPKRENRWALSVEALR